MRRLSARRAGSTTARNEVQIAPDEAHGAGSRIEASLPIDATTRGLGVAAQLRWLSH
jgi:hypothetical protein